MQERIYSVSELSREIKRIIEQFVPQVWVEGEISNFSQSRAGHIYFSLKDEKSLINCVIWRNIAYSMPFRLESGMHVMVNGGVTTYSGSSQYQVNVQQVRPVGVGSLHLAFEALKEKLAAEGLFAAERKRPIPQFPHRIGVVTSATGAAVRDILRVSQRRNPAIEMVIFPAQVQGKGAADTIIEGIETFNRMDNVDFIIIGRGGGSLEDLWAFNEEKLVRAVVVSRLPVVSAVGHEVDFTLSDFAADLRAPTPSAAAEQTVPLREDWLQTLLVYRQEFGRTLERRIESVRHRLESYGDRLHAHQPVEKLRFRMQQLDDIEKHIRVAMQSGLSAARSRWENIVMALKALDPRAVLQRGYAIVYRQPDGQVIKSIGDVQEGNAIAVELRDGRFGARVQKNKNS